MTKYHAKVSKGQAPTKAARTHVNKPSTLVPKRVRVEFTYPSNNGTLKTRKYTFLNFEKSKSAPKRWDAGHIKPRQLGGSGHSSNMFPQHPVMNRNSGIKGKAFILTGHKSKYQNRKPAGNPGTHLNRLKTDTKATGGGRSLTYRDVEDKIARKAAKYPGQVQVNHTVFYRKK